MLGDQPIKQQLMKSKKSYPFVGLINLAKEVQNISIIVKLTAVSFDNYFLLKQNKTCNY